MGALIFNFILITINIIIFFKFNIEIIFVQMFVICYEISLSKFLFFLICSSHSLCCILCFTELTVSFHICKYLLYYIQSHHIIISLLYNTKVHVSQLKILIKSTLTVSHNIISQKIHEKPPGLMRI